MFAKKDPTLKYIVILVCSVLLAATFKLWKPGFSNQEETSRAIRKDHLNSRDTIILHSKKVDSLFMQSRHKKIVRTNRKGYRFGSNMEYYKGFPDLNDCQLATAKRLGISSCNNRDEAILRKDSLVFVSESPYYVVDELDHSIPYLIPRASRLLEEISRAFSDSLVSRGVAPYKLLVTSVLRTTDDVKKLKRVNVNASENSCHRHGTTFDICYSKFIKVTRAKDTASSATWPPQLKQILAEVLDDQRRNGTCYVKYEYRQSCFHITAR